jgi:hypothetical protein
VSQFARSSPVSSQKQARAAALAAIETDDATSARALALELMSAAAEQSRGGGCPSGE